MRKTAAAGSHRYECVQHQNVLFADKPICRKTANVPCHWLLLLLTHFPIDFFFSSHFAIHFSGSSSNAALQPEQQTQKDWP